MVLMASCVVPPGRKLSANAAASKRRSVSYQQTKVYVKEEGIRYSTPCMAKLLR